MSGLVGWAQFLFKVLRDPVLDGLPDVIVHNGWTLVLKEPFKFFPASFGLPHAIIVQEQLDGTP